MLNFATISILTAKPLAKTIATMYTRLFAIVALLLALSIPAMSREIAVLPEEEDTLTARHPEYLPSLSIGTIAPEITARDTSGVELRLSNFRGKYVILDFWATWCGDCRREVPGLKKLYEETHDSKIGDKAMQWLSFSFDNKENDWRSFLRKEQFPWPQVSNLKRTREDPTFNDYQLHWIPAFFILDPDGAIVAKAITAQGLRTELLRIIQEHK